MSETTIEHESVEEPAGGATPTAIPASLRATGALRGAQQRT
ncbi:hypothetical protein [Streptomyces sp. 8N706]